MRPCRAAPFPRSRTALPSFALLVLDVARPEPGDSPGRDFNDGPALYQDLDVRLGDGFLDFIERFRLKANPLRRAAEELRRKPFLDGELHGAQSLLVRSLSCSSLSFFFCSSSVSFPAPCAGGFCPLSPFCSFFSFCSSLCSAFLASSFFSSCFPSFFGAAFGLFLAALRCAICSETDFRKAPASLTLRTVMFFFLACSTRATLFLMPTVAAITAPSPSLMESICCSVAASTGLRPEGWSPSTSRGEPQPGVGERFLPRTWSLILECMPRGFLHSWPTLALRWDSCLVNVGFFPLILLLVCKSVLLMLLDLLAVLVDDVDAILEDAGVESGPPDELLDVRADLAGGLLGGAFYGNLVALHLHRSPFLEMQHARHLLAKKVLDGELVPLHRDGHGEVAGADLERVLVGLLDAPDEIPDMGLDGAHHHLVLLGGALAGDNHRSALYLERDLALLDAVGGLPLLPFQRQDAVREGGGDALRQLDGCGYLLLFALLCRACSLSRSPFLLCHCLLMPSVAIRDEAAPALALLRHAVRGDALRR